MRDGIGFLEFRLDSFDFCSLRAPRSIYAGNFRGQFRGVDCANGAMRLHFEFTLPLRVLC